MAEEPEAEAEADLISLSILKIGGSQSEVKLPHSSTVGELKHLLRAQGVVAGLLAFRLVGEGGQLLKDSDCRLADAGLRDGSALTLVTGRARDYGAISQFDAVLEGCRNPQGVLAGENGELLVCYYDGPLRVYDAGHTLLREGRLPTSPPTQMALAPGGELLVAFTNRPVGVLDSATLELRRSFGERGDTNGIAVAGNRVFVSHSAESRVRVYDFATGDLVDTWSSFRHPCGMAVLEDDRLLIADRKNNRVQMLQLDGTHVADIGVGELKAPNDVAVDPDGNILVLDTGNERIAVFDQEGALLAGVMPGFFRDRGNTYSYLCVNQVTGAIAASFDDDHKVVVLAPLFPPE